MAPSGTLRQRAVRRLWILISSRIVRVPGGGSFQLLGVMLLHRQKLCPQDAENPLSPRLSKKVQTQGGAPIFRRKKFFRTTRDPGSRCCSVRVSIASALGSAVLEDCVWRIQPGSCTRIPSRRLYFAATPDVLIGCEAAIRRRHEDVLRRADGHTRRGGAPVLRRAD